MTTLKTRDVATAAFLVCRGNRIVETTLEGRDVILHFLLTPQLDSDIAEWKYGEAMVPARDFTSSRTYVLRLIHDAARQL